MKLYYTAKNNPGLAFEHQAAQLVPLRFFGMKCADGRLDQPDAAPIPETQGLFLLDTDMDRFEGAKLSLGDFVPFEDGFDTSFFDAGRNFQIEIRMRRHDASGVFSWSYRITNLDSKPHTIYSCISRFPLEGESYELYSQSSGWCAENDHGDFRPVSAGRIELGNSGGRSTDSGVPYAVIREKETGRCAAIHVLPIGDWIIRAHRVSGSNAAFTILEAGLSDRGLRLQIQPGERLVLPEILLQGFTGDIEASAPDFHRYLLDRFPHCKPTHAVYNSWLFDFDVVEPERLREQARIAADMGITYFTVDAGWFGDGPDWQNQVGNWQECTTAAFKGELRAFSDYIRSLGMQFGIWMEPERAAKGSKVYREHPEWFAKCDSVMFDLLNPEVEEYLLGQIIDVIRRYDARWIKIDYNSNFYRDLGGESFYRYSLASDRLMRRAKEACPDTIFEGCASGGLRTDILTTHEKYDQHFISDTVEPYHLIRMRHNGAVRLLPQMLGCWSIMIETPFGIGSYTNHNRLTRRKLFTPADGTWSRAVDVTPKLAALQTIAGCPGFGGDISTLGEETRNILRENIRFFEENRDFLSRCVCHMHTQMRPFRESLGWVVLEYENIDDEGSIIFAYRLNANVSEFMCYPRGLKDNKRYCVEGDCEKMTGQGYELASQGIALHCVQAFDAACIKISAAK